MVTNLAEVRAIVAAVEDPELPPLTIADLGIFRDIRIDGDAIEVTITPTYSGCPAMTEIAGAIRTAMARFGTIRVRTVLTPAWTTDWITPDGHQKLRDMGIAPPEPGTAPAGLFSDRNLICPRCRSIRTERISAFGATACKALHRCLDCREPFEAFKCH